MKMEIYIQCIFRVILIFHALHDVSTKTKHFKAVQTFLNAYNKKADELQTRDTEAWWNYETDMTKENRKKTAELSRETSKFVSESRKRAKELYHDLDELPKLWVRQLSMIKSSSSPKDPDEAKQISDLVSRMTAIYSDTTIDKEIKGKTLTLQLNKDLLPIMPIVRRRNLRTLRWIWTDWRNKVGPKVKPLYQKFVKLVNKGARENGYDDYGAHWRNSYEIGEDLKSKIEQIWEETKPLYNKLHAYVRFCLSKKFGTGVIPKDGLIPADMLNMWAQHWTHLYRHVVPYKDKKIPDVTEAMKKQKYDQKRMLKLAESFFVSIGLDPMPDSFWEKSVISRDRRKKQVCHPSSWDIGQGDCRYVISRHTSSKCLPRIV